MEDSYCTVRRWEDLPIDILVEIFLLFDIFQLTSGIDHVCSTWRMACCDPFLWRTLDLSMLQSNFIHTPVEPFVYVDRRSDATLTHLLKISLSLSKGNIMTLIFHFDLYMSNDQLTYIAQRCPKLRRLVLPAWNRIEKEGMIEAIRGWKYLESLTMPKIGDPSYILEAIAANCENFSELKIMGRCDKIFATSIAKCLPNLRVLSLRCSKLSKDGLILILDSLHHLQVLNISHCILMDQEENIIREIDPAIREKASRLCQFLTCMQGSCIMCQRTRTDDGRMRWYRYEEGLWKTDEVSSLSL